MTSQLDERLRRPSGIRSLTLGDTKLSYVPDGVGTLKARLWLPEPTDEFWAAHAEYLDEGGHLVTGNGGLLVERDGRALLIDAGVGPLTVGPPENPFGTLSGGKLLDSLAALGHSPADIEAVAITHLHHDHVGWAWHPAPGSDRPAFTAADYLIAEPEWTQRHFAEAQGLGDMLEAMRPRVRTVVEGEEVFPGVHVMFAPGHSVGHAAFVISAGGQRVIAFGDAFHSPVQISHPLWEVPADHDREQAASLRHSLVLELAEPDTIGFGIHFADVPFGRVRIEDGRPAWHPIDA
ncbi:MBL fold metallo-hydrolase [Kutzneria sp. CA-103260]|uniref:MBL fold metallo-hydrolase n=1 Tax=Kutzneria sp. CA-103260 TaxID=2802641 RepID=UPI001BAB95F1|nr:MBL fold metallo-hydrolase [Kutzneria sp. CA-103260]QUQ64838.1 metallo-beta-lactamase [Kutzneria sp. CA-103260]